MGTDGKVSLWHKRSLSAAALPCGRFFVLQRLERPGHEKKRGIKPLSRFD